MLGPFTIKLVKINGVLIIRFESTDYSYFTFQVSFWSFVLKLICPNKLPLMRISFRINASNHQAVKRIVRDQLPPKLSSLASQFSDVMLGGF